MRNLLLLVAMVSGYVAFGAQQGPPQEYLEVAKKAPGTVFVAKNRETGEVRYLRVREHVPREIAAQKAASLNFEQMARYNAEKDNSYTASNEDNKRSSQNSWRFGFVGVGPRGGVWAGGARGWGGGWGWNGGWGGGWAGGGGCGWNGGCGGGCWNGGCGGWPQYSYWGGGGYAASCGIQQCGWAWPNVGWGNVNMGYYPYAQATVGMWDVAACNWGW